MSPLYAVFDDFKQHLKTPNHVLTKKRTEQKSTITIYCKEGHIHAKKELDYMDVLFLKYNLMATGFYPFEVTEIISLRRDYFLCLYFLVLESSKIMPLKIDPTKVLDYFNNMVDPSTATQLHSFSIGRSICHLAVQTDGHSLHYRCHCFSCGICRILLTMLLSRTGFPHLLKILTK